MRPTLLSRLLIAGALALPGCGRDAPGVIITEDGTVVTNSPEHQRGRIAAIARRQLDEQLGAHWRSAVDIAELPDWDSDQHSMGHAWLWAKATVAVTLVGDGAAPLPESADAYRDAVTGYMRGHVDRPGKNLTVAVATVTDAARFAALSGAPPASAAAPAAGPARPPAPAGPRRYAIQPGDTLGDISVVFYGSAAFWRDLVAANPGLDGSHLVPGQEIVIPPRPAATGP